MGPFLLFAFNAEEFDLSVQQELSHVSPGLSPEQASLCEGYLSVEEVLTALNGMANGKAPSCNAGDAVRNIWSTQSILCSVDDNDVISFSI